jgi:hypothetical protein
VYRGKDVRAHAVCGVVQGYGQYSAALRAYQAPAASFEKSRALLAAVDASVVISNPRQVAGVDRMVLPKGTSHDAIYGDYNRAYRERAKAADRMNQGQREATMGQVRMKDPATGRIYDLPQGRYDPTVGGYRNPRRPDELLVPAQPGE